MDLTQFPDQKAPEHVLLSSSRGETTAWMDNTSGAPLEERQQEVSGPTEVVEGTYPGTIGHHYGLQTRTLQFLYKEINDSHRPAIPVENTTHSRPPITNLGLNPTEEG